MDKESRRDEKLRPDDSHVDEFVDIQFLISWSSSETEAPINQFVWAIHKLESTVSSTRHLPPPRHVYHPTGPTHGVGRDTCICSSSLQMLTSHPTSTSTSCPTIIFLFPVILSLLIPPISHPHPSFRISISASSSIQPSNQSKPSVTPDVNSPAGTRITPFEMKRSSLRLDHDISEARIHFGLSVWIVPSPHSRGGVMVILSDHLNVGSSLQCRRSVSKHNTTVVRTRGYEHDR